VNKVTQVLLATGALGVAAIVGLGAVSSGNLARARQSPRPTLPPLQPVIFTTPDGWLVGESDAVVALSRPPTQSSHSVATITVCRSAYAVDAAGDLTNGLKKDAAKIVFYLLQRADLRGVVKPQEATLDGLPGHYLDFTIPADSPLGRDVDTWVARTAQAPCLAVFDTTDEGENPAPAGLMIGVPTITRLGLFGTPDGGNLMVLMTSQGIGTNGKPDKADIEEATAIVEGFTVRPPPPQ
jgi:hypothetical protein